jgi:hypothetical protein
MVKKGEVNDSDEEDERPNNKGNESSDSGTDDERYFGSGGSADKGPILNSKGNSEGTQKAIDSRKKREKNAKRRQLAEAKRKLDPKKRQADRAKAKRLEAKELADEAKAEAKAKKYDGKARAAFDAANKKSRAPKNFTPREKSISILCIKKVLPCGSNDWDEVLKEIYKMLDSDEPRRDAEAYKNKFILMKNTQKPTGSATIPDDVRIFFIALILVTLYNSLPWHY